MDDSNTASMLFYENRLAAWLRMNPDKWLDYTVTPIYKDNELLPRQVHNDKKGAEFWEHFEAKNAFTKEFSVGDVEYYVDERPDEAYGKDWNDVLKFQTLRLEQEKATTIPQQEQEMAY